MELAHSVKPGEQSWQEVGVNIFNIGKRRGRREHEWKSFSYGYTRSKMAVPLLIIICYSFSGYYCFQGWKDIKLAHLQHFCSLVLLVKSSITCLMWPLDGLVTGAFHQKTEKQRIREKRIINFLTWTMTGLFQSQISNCNWLPHFFPTFFTCICSCQVLCSNQLTDITWPFLLCL